MINNIQTSSSRQLSDDLQEITLMTTQPQTLAQPPPSSQIDGVDDGVERISVDPDFISTLADKKNSLSETIQKEYEKYKHLPAPVRYLVAIPFLGFFVGFYFIASEQFAIGGPLLGVSVTTLFAVDRWAKSTQRKMDNLIKQRGNHVVLESDVVCRNNFGHSTAGEARPTALEARLLEIKPQQLEPVIDLAPRPSPRDHNSENLGSQSRFGSAQLQ
ncbi:MAG: hypothetical protein ACKO47_06915 [Alphaproteobacteria bacterium]